MKQWFVWGMLLGVLGTGTACKSQSLNAAADTAAAPATPPPQGAAPGTNNGLPAGHPPITADGAGATGGTIEGRLELGPAATEHVKMGDTVFIIARNGTTNAMVAVAKLQAPDKFPLAFKLTPQNVMMPGGALSGPIKLSARVDKDGDAITKKPGDVVGEVAQAVEVPAQNVVLTLNQVL